MTMLWAWILVNRPWSLQTPTVRMDSRDVKIAREWEFPGTDYRIIQETNGMYHVIVDRYRVSGGTTFETAAANAQPLIDRWMSIRGREVSTPDPTMGQRWCSTHKTHTATAYLNNGSYGCLQCNPYRKPFRGLPALTAPVRTDPQQIGEMPDWMC